MFYFKIKVPDCINVNKQIVMEIYLQLRLLIVFFQHTCAIELFSMNNIFFCFKSRHVNFCVVYCKCKLYLGFK